jgi:AAA family ATP:ADP antiporter
MLFGFAYFFCLLCSYYLLRPLRDAMGLHGGAGHLQWLFTATFVVMLVLVPIFGSAATRWPPRRFVPIVYRFFALNILGFGLLFATGVEEALVSRAFFVWISVFNLFVVSIFWSVMADHFSSEQGRRLFGFIAAGGTAGALAGPAMTASLVTNLGPASLTVLSAVMLELAVRCFHRLARSTVSPGLARDARNSRFEAEIGEGIFAGIALILRDRYLLGIVFYLLLHTFASTLLYFEQGKIVASLLLDTASRTQFFALVDLAVSCASLALQILVTGRFLRRFGVTSALVLLPIVSLASIAAIAFWPSLLILAIAQGGRRALDFAIVRPAREVLFTVVSRAAKYKAKSVIETVVYRGGDAVSGWVLTALAAAGIGITGLTAVFIPLGLVWSGLAARLGTRQDEMARHGSAHLQQHEFGNPAFGSSRLEQGGPDKRGFK